MVRTFHVFKALSPLSVRAARLAVATLSTLLVLTTLAVAPSRIVRAQSPNPRLYDMGSPTLTDLWVDQTTGSDANSGASPSEALRTVAEAWGRIPIGTPLTATGYRIMLAAGEYTDDVPNYWESRYGTFACPVVLQAANPGTATFQNLNFFDCRYLYLIGIRSTSGGGDVVHFEACDYVLLRECTITGTGDIFNYDAPQETLKVNQSQYLFVEGCDISGAFDNAVDCVAVQYGHFVGNRIHRSADWCMYLKGGSAYIRVEGNEFYDGGTGGFTAGQGTGFEFMQSPWLHYEAYDIKFIDNIVHDTDGAGMGVNGGYNILLAHNTLYRVGRRSHALEFAFGLRSCDGDADRCRNYLAQGGWGTAERSDGTNEQPIPNRNVYVYNNLLYNPAGFRSEFQHFAIYGPRTPGSGSNIASPARADVNLQIRGNVIWNGPTDLPLGIEDSDQGCQAGNATCGEAQLRADNAINTIEPQLVDPDHGDYRAMTGNAVFSFATQTIPAFPGGDRPSTPSTPEGVLANAVTRDYFGDLRTGAQIPGAIAGSSTGGGGGGGGATTFDASGAVRKRARTFEGVLITFTLVAGTGAVPDPVLTDANGEWRQSGFAEGATYRATPSLSGFVFKPASRDFGGPTTDLNFKPKRR